MMTSLTLASALPAAGAARRFRYRLEFQRASDGRMLDAGYMDPSWAEFWGEQAIFQAQREGILGPDPTQAVIIEHPVFLDEREGSLQGIKVSVSQGRETHETEFNLADAFSAPGESALKTLFESKLLDADDKASLKISAEPINEPADDPKSEVRATVKRDPLPLLDGRFEDWLKLAEPCGEIGPKDHPIFLPRKLFERAREYCFKTGKQEGGAMMVARMYRQMAPAEIFAVVHAVVELRHAKQSLFGFEPTAETFADLNTQLGLRRNRLGFPNEVAQVLVHNHPFEPSVRDDGEANCPTCPLQKECQLTSSFYSTSDVKFHLSMYGRQPYVAGIVIGLTPRREDDVRMFCLEGTRTRERGFYWIEEPSSEGRTEN